MNVSLVCAKQLKMEMYVTSNQQVVYCTNNRLSCGKKRQNNLDWNLFYESLKIIDNKNICIYFINAF